MTPRIILVCAMLLYVVRLGQPAWTPHAAQIELFDEHYTAFTAHRLATGDPVAFEKAPRRFEYDAASSTDLALAERIEWSHPPGAPLLMTPFIWIGGYGATSVRLAAVLAALLTLALMQKLAERADQTYAMVLLAVDGMFFVFARTAMPQMLMTAALAGAAACVLAIVHRSQHARVAAIGAGACFGLAVAIRWTSLPVMVAVLAALAICREARGARIGWRIAIVVGAAVATYLATFVPYLAHGHSVRDLIDLHAEMWWFHTHLPTDYTQSTPAWTWPLQLHALSFGGGHVDGGTWTVLVLGNRLVWWLSLPALLAGLVRARRRELAELVPVAVVLAIWLPWVVLGRFGMAYYLLPALPFNCILVARWLRAAPRIRIAVVIAAVVVLAISYPAIAGVPVSSHTFELYQRLFMR